jgi:HemY protein
MRSFLLILLVFALAILGGVSMAKDPGYTLLVYRHWSVEMPLWLALVCALVAFIVFYYLVRMLLGLGYYNQQFSDWRSERKKHKAHKSLCHGLLELIEGDATRAQRYLLQHVGCSDIPVLHYLSAAETAQMQGEIDQRDKYLRLAHKADPSAEFAIGLTQAELQIKQKQQKEALVTLRHLNGLSKHNTKVLGFLYQLYVDLEDWHHLRQLLPDLKKQHFFDQSNYTQLEEKVCAKELSLVNNADLESLWGEFPRHVRQTPLVIAVYAKRLLDLERADLVEPLVRSALKKRWDDSLVTLYGELQVSTTLQLKTALSWLKHQPKSASLQVAIAKLSSKEGVPGQAKGYFEQAIQCDASARNCIAYAEFLEQQKEMDLARMMYKKASQIFRCC